MFDESRLVFFKGMLAGTDIEHFFAAEEKLRDLYREDPHAPLFFCITSPDGLLSPAINFFWRVCIFGPRNLTTIALDDVSSAAILLYIAGENRLVTPHTSFFFHYVGVHAEEYSREVTAACKGNITQEDILALMTKKGKELSAQDALNMGLAHTMLSYEQEAWLREHAPKQKGRK